jgi:hypothetical protein
MAFRIKIPEYPSEINMMDKCIKITIIFIIVYSPGVEFTSLPSLI